MILNKKVAIVGGGPGGLTLARLLQQEGVDASYETNMRNRAAISAKESLDNGELMHSADALATMVNMFKAH